MTETDLTIPDRSLLGFPVTPYGDDGELALDQLATQSEVLLSYGARALFVGCGTGEVQCLSLEEHERIVRASVDATNGRVPVFGAAAFGLPNAVDMVRRAARAGASAILAFPPYMSTLHQAALLSYYERLADESPLPVVLYQRDGVVFSRDTLLRLAAHPRIAGLKDGTGAVEVLQAQVSAVDDPNFFFFNGTPTAELFAPALGAVGVASYSSALLNVVPEFAEDFNKAFLAHDTETMQHYTKEVVLPFVELRDRVAGYAVSLIKEGVNLRGGSVGPVRGPLPTPTPADREDLSRWLTSIDLDTPLRPKGGVDAEREGVTV
ncbi:5-dehydro-4-deoxyglucarate dehydratase [Aeromicrobium phragmitis]|uniref:5-dehydro-4-deoxyglucarate dehydratase n=1 Tax=Aeromicrobium phragmitis TaxID=2478914 RepID=A0A3L8PH52_9ACTN|nr:5-dehydro-4-deoxyglucarate dehydratase [Aeromicrobium phragmitis]RLV54556.1 5-dehydro-4-deoxyglucarate dehydratase [Aeromicrobium phragmitis]